MCVKVVKSILISSEILPDFGKKKGKDIAFVNYMVVWICPTRDFPLDVPQEILRPLLAVQILYQEQHVIVKHQVKKGFFQCCSSEHAVEKLIIAIINSQLK